MISTPGDFDYALARAHEPNLDHPWWWALDSSYWNKRTNVPLAPDHAAKAEESWRLLLQAASLGHSEAQYKVSRIFKRMPLRNDQLYVQWLTASAEAGYAKALITLGKLYQIGSHGVPQDTARAFQLFAEAAAQGEPDACYRVGYAFEHGEGRRANAKSANTFYDLAASKGHRRAQYSLAQNLLYGCGCEADEPKAIELLEKSAQRGEKSAQLELGRLFYYGEQIDSDPLQAGKWLALAAGGDHASEAAELLSQLYEEHWEVFKDIPELNYQVRLAAAMQGKLDAMTMLGMFFAAGPADRRNPEMAVHWYQKAAEGGNEIAQHNLARLYEAGTGTKQNLFEAARWFASAAAQESDGTSWDALVQVLSEAEESDDACLATLRILAKAHASTSSPTIRRNEIDLALSLEQMIELQFSTDTTLASLLALISNETLAAFRHQTANPAARNLASIEWRKRHA